MALGLIFAALSIWLAIQSVRQFLGGFVSLEFWGTYPKLRAYWSEDATAFWLLAFIRLALIFTSGFLAANLVRAA